MELNVGLMDQKARIAVGAILGLVSLGILAGYVPVNKVASPVLGVVAAVLLATGYFRKCGLYSALGVNTSEK